MVYLIKGMCNSLINLTMRSLLATAEFLYLYLGLLCPASNVMHSVLGDSGDFVIETELDEVGD